MDSFLSDNIQDGAGAREVAAKIREKYSDYSSGFSRLTSKYPKTTLTVYILLSSAFIIAVLILIFRKCKEGFRENIELTVTTTTKPVEPTVKKEVEKEYWIKVIASTNPSLYRSKTVTDNRPMDPVVEVNRQQYLPKSNGAHLLGYKGGKLAFSKWYSTWTGSEGQCELLYQALDDMTDKTRAAEFDLIILTSTNGMGDLRSISGRLHATGKFDKLPWYALQDDSYTPYIWIYNCKKGVVVTELVGETSILYENMLKI